jgi:hypothetical protein
MQCEAVDALRGSRRVLPEVVFISVSNYGSGSPNDRPPRRFCMRKELFFAAMIILLAVAPVRSQSITLFFNTANLEPLAQSPQLRVLAGQSSNKSPQADVNAFDDFFLFSGPGKLEVNFNGQLQNKGQKTLPYWAGNTAYSNHEILYDLQAGFSLVKAKFNIPNARAGNVTVYKTLFSKQIVYSYAVSLPRNVCQQYLFTPATGGLQIGMRANCVWSLSNARQARPGGRM